MTLMPLRFNSNALTALSTPPEIAHATRRIIANQIIYFNILIFFNIYNVLKQFRIKFSLNKIIYN